MNRVLKNGRPWRTQLEIKELSPGKLVAEVTMVGNKYLRPVAGVGSIFICGALFGICKGVFAAPMDYVTIMGFTGLLLAALAITLMCIGLVSYLCRLTIEHDEVRYEHTFFWKTKRYSLPLDCVDSLKCWSRHVSGGSAMKGHSERSKSYAHLCIHFHQSIPVLSLKDIEYLSHTGQFFQKHVPVLFGADGVMVEEEAVQKLLESGKKIEECIGVPFKLHDEN